MARQVVFNKTGGSEVLEIVEVPTPTPAAGEVRIRVKAIGLNRSEINLRAGTYLLAPARSVVKHPAKLKWEEAAAMWMQFATAWAGLVDIAKISAKETVLITAASSS